jgi:colanic acid/amylovoran biosynthesis glycosyltransferase
MAKVAYLLNSYPMTSTTFIRREIQALEQSGMPIVRFAVRHWDGPLVEPQDIEEQKKTNYLLTGNLLNLLILALGFFVSSPMRSARAFGVVMKLWRASGGVVRHIAYFLQAAYFVTQSNKFGITHVHAHFATNATAVCLISKIMGGPSYSFTVHGPDELRDPTALSYPLKVSHAKFIAAISFFCKSQIELFSGTVANGKIVIVPCGLDLKEFVYQSNLQVEPNQLVCVGRLCPQKGQTMIPAVLASLKGEFPDLKILLVGDGESRSLIEQDTERFGVANQLVMLGWKSNEEVRRLIATSRALLLPSSAEGLPVVIMEAFALHTPVISTYIAGIPELVDSSCGWLVPAGNEDTLAEAIRELLTQPLEISKGYGDVGRYRVELRHNIETSASILMREFQK